MLLKIYFLVYNRYNVEIAKEKLIRITDESIRHHFDKESGTHYFSIVDVIDIVTDSSDARNYWKVLKNRLKKSNPELVTSCNQLKMIAQDGKSYLTDTADSKTMLEIIQDISPSSVRPFQQYFDNIVSTDGHIRPPSLTEDPELELMVDAYETSKDIYVSVLIAGVATKDLSISVDCKTLTIKCTRLTQQGAPNLEDYLVQELYWGVFSRTISLPSLVDIDNSEASINHGLLTIKLPKIDLERTRIIKAKSLS